MNEVIELNVPNNNLEWLEILDKKYQNSYKWPVFVTCKMTVSPCNRFAFIFSNYQLNVIDTYNGIFTTLELTENYEEDSEIIYLTEWDHQFCPITFNTGALFRTGHLESERDDLPRNLYANKIKLDFDEKTFQHNTYLLELKSNVNNYWISQLFLRQSVIILTEHNNANNIDLSFEMQQFDLIKMEFYGPKVTYECGRNSVFDKYAPTFHNNCFYDFEKTFADNQRQFEENVIFLPDLFGSINCYDPKVRNGKQQKIKLVNDLSCLGIAGKYNLDQVQTDGNWCNNLLYFHVTKLTTEICLPTYYHYFALLNLDTLMWRKITFNSQDSFGNEHLFSSSIPMAISIGNENQVVLVKSLSLLNLELEEYYWNNPSLYDNFVNVGGHAHCSSQRVSLRRPESLQLLTIQSMSKLNSQWKNTKSGKILTNCLEHKPPINDHQLSHHPTPVIYKASGVYACNKCESKTNDILFQLRRLQHPILEKWDTFMDLVENHNFFCRLLFFIIAILFVYSLSDTYFYAQDVMKNINFKGLVDDSSQIYFDDQVNQICFIFTWTKFYGIVARHFLYYFSIRAICAEVGLIALILFLKLFYYVRSLL